MNVVLYLLLGIGWGLAIFWFLRSLRHTPAADDRLADELRQQLKQRDARQ